MARVGVLGLGKMGSAFATNLLSKINEVHVYNRNRDRLPGLVANGAIAHPSLIELGKSVDVVVENQLSRHKAALPLGSLAKQFFTTSVNQGQGEMDFSSIALTLQKLNGIEAPA